MRIKPRTGEPICFFKGLANQTDDIRQVFGVIQSDFYVAIAPATDATDIFAQFLRIVHFGKCQIQR